MWSKPSKNELLIPELQCNERLSGWDFFLNSRHTGLITDRIVHQKANDKVWFCEAVTVSLIMYLQFNSFIEIIYHSRNWLLQNNLPQPTYGINLLSHNFYIYKEKGLQWSLTISSLVQNPRFFLWIN